MDFRPYSAWIWHLLGCSIRTAYVVQEPKKKIGERSPQGVNVAESRILQGPPTVFRQSTGPMATPILSQPRHGGGKAEGNWITHG